MAQRFVSTPVSRSAGVFVRIQASEASPKPLAQLDGGGHVFMATSATSARWRKLRPKPAGGALFQLGVADEKRGMIALKLLGKANDVCA
jgi:hypothetical protein